MIIKINTLKDIQRAAREFLHAISKEKTESINHTISECIAFYGEMGAGKTTFIKALCRELKVKNIVTSPTFALINEYHTINNQIIYHFDFYRIDKIEELYDFGYEEYFYSNHLCFIEWPEKIEPLLPQDFLEVHIIVNHDGSRLIEIKNI